MRKGESNPFCKNNQRNISCKADEFALHKIQYAKHMHTLNLPILIQPTLCTRKWTVLGNHYGCFKVGALEFQITQLALCHLTFSHQGSNGVHNQESPVCALPLYKSSREVLYILPVHSTRCIGKQGWRLPRLCTRSCPCLSSPCSFLAQ
jgi:hypothetical protein